MARRGAGVGRQGAIVVATVDLSKLIPGLEGHAEIVVGDGAKLAESSKVLAIRAKSLKAGATVQVVAVRPDLSVEPLLWIYRYKPEFHRTYYYAGAVALPAGTRIEMSPAGSGTVGLFVKPGQKADAR